jgi:hypothetical protein
MNITLSAQQGIRLEAWRWGMTEGGKNALFRYERGEAKPMPAVVNLFRLLDCRLVLLKELA